MFNRTISLAAGFCLILFPVLNLLGFLIHPLNTTDAKDVVLFVVSHPFKWALSHILFVFAQPMAVGAALFLAGKFRSSSPLLSLFAPALVVFGSIFFTIHFGSEITIASMLTISPENHPQLVPAIQAAIDGKGPMPIMLIGLCLNIGLMALAFGLFAAKSIPRWQCLSFGFGAFLLASAAVIDVLGAFSCLFLLAGMAPVGWQLLFNAKN